METEIKPPSVAVWPIDRLVPYERNARTHSPEQVRKIAASIAEFGFTNPILVAADDGILAGHGRLAAARDLGLAEVPVIVLDHLSPAQRRAYVIADNQLALGAGWDMEMLQEEIVGLELADFDLELLGFSQEELDKMLDPEGINADGAEGSAGDDEDRRDDSTALPIVLTPEEYARWRRAKAGLGYSTDKAAFLQLVEDYMDGAEQ
jgi:hypothetical protein